jgi:hypothetical protein
MVTSEEETKSLRSMNFNIRTKLHKNGKVLRIGIQSETGCSNTVLVASLSHKQSVYVFLLGTYVMSRVGDLRVNYKTGFVLSY